ncbi:hypothetical protein K503DRAFT_793838 [Rhizopogon vinicolor AM-OR11-026]|uniref:Alpha-type protein kinase domain-containing protein n=1 Tax=Rhizopogon vinicolor AM-OR11-026 TaxID=1314800 RepID=A0A1B7MS56_9AGAM|nr:hypothetical protein K503DRAFT_793838 [Rhizopogon vinicolor AM-OR11-026]
MIGSAGSFKSCHPALICSPLAGGSMLALPHPAILSAAQLVAKRVFFRKGQGKGSLMGMAYTFVNEMLKIGKVWKDVENLVPRLRLVHAALAIPADANNLNNDFGANYLVEERIIGKFVKYINNNQAIPAHGLGSKEADIGSFLCFVQHVQCQLSNEMVYLSDFQGE